MEPGTQLDKDEADDDLSLFVLASDLPLDARSFGIGNQEIEIEEDWHDCESPNSAQDPLVEDDYSDLEELQVLKLQGKDKAGRRILRIVGRYLPAPVITGERLKKYIYQKIFNSVSEGPFCIVYIHTSVQSEDNSPGVSTLRWIYEELPEDYKERLQVIYFLHPGIRSRLLFATLGRFLLSGGLYWKLKYINRLEFLWDNVRKGQVEIPDFVCEHDDLLEDRPLMDYGVETDPFHLHDMPSMGSVYSRSARRWAS
eukprot:Gb_16648 [translate_table: standard]